MGRAMDDAIIAAATGKLMVVYLVVQLLYHYHLAKKLLHGSANLTITKLIRC